MARKVRSAEFDTRAARAKLAARGKPYYVSIGPGLHLGYRKSKAGSGRWVVRLYVDEGTKDYVVETIADADDMLDANGATVLDFWQAQEEARKCHKRLSGADASNSGPYSVKDAIEDYLQWMEANTKSAKDSRYRAEALILPTLGSKDVRKLKTKEIRDWLDKVTKTPPRLRTKEGNEQQFRELSDDPDATRRRQASANRVLTILKAALNHAWRDGKITTDEQWRKVKPFGKVDVARVHYLTVAEAQRLVNASEPAFRKMVQAALQSGARYGELAALKVNDFNPDAGILTIRDSKSGKPRHIVLTDEGIAFFKSVIAGRSGDETMLPTRAGGKWQKSHQNRPMADACKNGKIIPPIGFHGLRHTWASLAVMNGVPLMVVAKNLGHADTRMVEKHYGHLSASYITEAIRAGAPRFGNVEPSNVVGIDR